MTTEKAATVKTLRKWSVSTIQKKLIKLLKTPLLPLKVDYQVQLKLLVTGAQIAISYTWKQQIRKRAKLIYGNGNNGFTVEEALTKAADDESALYLQKDTKGIILYRMLVNEPNGRVEFPALRRSCW